MYDGENQAGGWHGSDLRVHICFRTGMEDGKVQI